MPFGARGPRASAPRRPWRGCPDGRPGNRCSRPQDPARTLAAFSSSASPSPRTPGRGGVGGCVLRAVQAGRAGRGPAEPPRPRPWRPRPPPRSAGSRAWPGHPPAAESLGCREAGGAGAGPGKPSFESTFFSKPQAGPERGLTHRPGLRGWRGAAGVLPGWGRAPGSCHSPRVSWRQATLHGAPHPQLFSLHTQPPPLALTHTHTQTHAHPLSSLFFLFWKGGGTRSGRAPVSAAAAFSLWSPGARAGSASGPGAGRRSRGPGGAAAGRGVSGAGARAPRACPG